MHMPSRLALAAGLSLIVAASASASVVQLSQPTIDRWMYPFNSLPGSRPAASVFGAPGNQPTFDDRDAQYLVGFDTNSVVAAGKGASAYDVTSVTVTATIASGEFGYNPVYSSYRGFLDPSDPDYVAPSPNGTSIELYGVGFRNGYTKLSYNPSAPSPPHFKQASNFGIPGPPSAGTRNAFAIDFDGSGTPRDVSNNVAGRFETNPFAVATTNLLPGATVTEGTVMSFQIDLSDPFVLGYIQDGLDKGSLGFVISSLHEASQGGPVTYPNFFTKFSGAPGATFTSLTIELASVPEASSIVLASCAALGVGAMGWIRRRRRS